MGSVKEKIFNAVKLSLAAIAAISIAVTIDADFPVSAGIIAILTIQRTKKETIKTVTSRFVAFVGSLIVALGCYSIFGYGIGGYMVFLVVFIFVGKLLEWNNAITMCAVSINHFRTYGNMEPESILNEIIIYCIGAGIGILVNLHLHQDVDYMEELKEETDTQMIKILSHMAELIVNHDVSDHNKEYFMVLKESLRKAKNVAEENLKNQFGSGNVYDREYILMREKQCQVLYEMYKSIKIIETTPITAGRISGFLMEMSRVYHKSNTGEELLFRFHEMNNEMKRRPLPVDRKEFEDRATLYGLLRRIEEIIRLKIEFATNYKIIEKR